MRILLYILVALTATFRANVYAQKTLIGVSIIDDFLEFPLPDAKVTLMSSDSIPIQDIEVVKYLNANGNVAEVHAYATLDRGKGYLLRGCLDGYEDGWAAIDLQEDSPAQLFIGNLRLRRIFSRELDEVTVKATKVKMFWKGDTIVYNADAFNLPSGSMLDDLIRQMPGVTMNDEGEIFVNGRKIDELLLGSKSFFRGKSQVLLKNLPYYTVKNIKVYDKQSELSEAIGTDVEAKKYVMDVNLASEYNRGMIANVEAAGGTSDRYLGRAFLLGFEDPLRFSLLGNVNNVNETRHIGQSSSWTPDKMPKSQVTTRSVAGELDFDNKKVRETLNVDFSYTSDLRDMNRRTELFLDGMTPLTTLQSSSRTRNHILKLSNYFRLMQPRIGFDIGYSHRTYHSSQEELTEKRDSTLVSRLSDFGYGHGKAWDIYGSTDGSFILKKGIGGTIIYRLVVKREEDGSMTRIRYEYQTSPAHSIYNVNDFESHNTFGSGLIQYEVKTKKDIRIGFEEFVKLELSKKHDYLYHPDSLNLPSQKDALLAITDFSNSYNSRFTTEEYHSKLKFNKFKVLVPDETMPQALSYRQWEISLDIAPKIQSLHYMRGGIDTLVNSNVWTFKPEFNLNLYPTGKYNRQIDLHAIYYIETPSLYDMIDYRDDSTPLIVKLGNPSLKGNQISYVKADFYSRGAHQSLVHVGASFRYFHRSTAQSVEYDPLSGTTTYRPVNVRGNYISTLAFDMTRTFGSSHQWTFSDNTDGSFENSVDHSMLQGETESHINKVRTLTLHDGMYLQYSKGSLNVRATGDVRWRHSAGRMRDFSTLNAVDFQYGMSARYTIPVLNTTVSADGTMYSRRGYGSSSLNTNDFVLNASLSQSMLKGKLVARIEGFDLLHQLSQVNYEVNAQGRVETWYRSLPHYVMLHLIYNFSINPKKR